MAIKIDPTVFVGELSRRGVGLWAGVPDSLLADLCAAASEGLGDRFVVAANEGNAVGLACGWHLATGGAACVYMQNSGEGNAVNPLMSLADPEVYSVPLLLVVGWRGEPGVPDEPQHAKQGQVTLALLEAMGVPHEVLDPGCWRDQLGRLLARMEEEQCPVTLVVRKGTFSAHPFMPGDSGCSMTREGALSALLDAVGAGDLLVSTTGKESRELFELREARGEGHSRDFLTVGGMGHTSSIALGLAMGRPDRVVWCLDGDGSMLMHLGALPVLAQAGAANLRYVVNVNGAHESVGGQPNAARGLDVPALLRACGIPEVLEASRPEEVRGVVSAMRGIPGSALVLRTRQGSRPDLGRPTTTPRDNKLAMMREVGSA